MAYPIRQAVDAAGDSVRRVIRAFHGSPHDFDSFDASKIGTGQRAQSYGHGLYFAGDEDTARHYRDTLSGQALVDGKPVDRNESAAYMNLAERAARGEDIFSMTADAEKERALLADLVEQMRGRYQADPEGQGVLAGLGYAKNRLDLADEFLEASRRLRQSQIARNPGRMYEVEIGHPEDVFLDWDRPVRAGSQQDNPSMWDAWFRAHALADDPGSPAAWRMPLLKSRGHGEDVWAAMSDVIGPDKAAGELMDMGIPGVRYLDGKSRRAGAGTSNYVIFPGAEDRIRILRKYGLLAPMALPAIDQGESLGN